MGSGVIGRLFPKVALLAGIVAAHLLPLTLLVTGISLRHVVAFLVGWTIAGFAIAPFLHRYFAHRAFRTSRGFQLVMGVVVSLLFGDPVGFAAKHRKHHRHADREGDPHDPRQGVWHTWAGHILEDEPGERETLRLAADLARYPELLWLRRYYFVPGVLAVLSLLVLGGPSLVAAGYALPWCLYGFHGPALVNYFCHRGGRRRYATPDASTNRRLVAVLLWGEGWHNNHHHYPAAARAGFFRHEWDLAYRAIQGLAFLGLVWDVRDVPAAAKAAA